MIESLILASSGLLSFGSITIVILLLTIGKGFQNGIGYVLGYNTSYAIIGITIILLGSGKVDSIQTNSNNFFPILLIVLGTLLFLLGIKNLTHKKAKEIKNSHSHHLFPSLNTLTPIKSFFFGVMVTIINFKNLTLFLSAVGVVYLSDFDLKLKIINVLLITLIFCFSLTIPIIIALLFPKKSKKILLAIKNTIEKQKHNLGIYLPILFGSIFLVNGVIKLIK